MNSNFQVNRTEICNICGCRELSILARRSDNLDVLICQHCSMGVLELFPNDTALLYGDDYYESDKTAVASGYADYDANSEHGVLWAAEIVKLITDSGRVLDIGCANGFLLNALGFGYETFGIEANEKAANFAETIGVKIIGNDILDPKLLLEFAGYFDVITAIAVFEHIEDFKGAVQAALKMLKPDGVLIFEVPLISENPDSNTWFTSSLEHLFYPTEKGLRYLFNNQLNTQMIGGELVIRDYASNFFGMATSSDSTLFRIKNIYEKVRFSLPIDLTPAERRAQLLLKVIHAADSQPNNLLFIHELFAHHLKLPFITRCLDLWKRDSIRHQSTLDYLKEVEIAKEFNSEALNAERDAVVAELYLVYHSISWQITLPLRILTSWSMLLFSKIRVLVFVVLPSLTWTRLVKGLKLLLGGDVAAMKSSIRYVARENSNKVSRSSEVVHISASALSHGQPLVSVVIPCFNYGQFVVGAVDSVLSQTLTNVEIIVVDGGSTDTSTIETLKAFKRPRTAIFLREGRHFVGDNRNFGVAKAKGRYICCLDADDTLDPTYLEKAVFQLETYGYDIVSTAISFVGAKEGKLDILEFPDLTDMVNGNHVLTCAVFRRQLWESSGGYVDIGVGMHHVAEDWDFWLRLTAKGARIRNISGETLFNYRIHQGGSLSSAADVKPLADQKAAILDRNRELLTPEAFRISTELQSRNLRCNPSETALTINFNAATSSSKKTLLLAMPFSMVGGAERLLSGLCLYLAGNGWRIIVVTTLDQDASFGSSIDWFKESSSEVYELPRFLEPEERGDFIHYLIASRKPDCILNAGSRLFYELLPLIKKSHGSLCVVDLLFNCVGHVKSHMEFKKFFTFALAENQEVYDWYLKMAGWPENQIRKMSSGVDLIKFYPTSRPINLIDKYRISEDELIVGFSGRLSEEKAPDVFVETAKLCQGVPNLRFVMTGAGPMAKKVSTKLKSLPTSVKFEFAGLVDDVSQYLALYDVLVLPSRLDGRPLVVMEALACGVPVIGSNVGALPDLIEDGKNGYLVPAANAEMFAEKVCILAGNRALLRQFKINARLTAEDKLSDHHAYHGYEIALCEAVDVNRKLNELTL